MNENARSSQLVGKSIKIEELSINATPVYPALDSGPSDSILTDRIFTNSIQTLDLQVTDLSVGTLVVEDLVAGTAELNSLTVSTNFAAGTVTSAQTNIGTLNTTTSSVAQLFTNEISASQQITTNTYTVPHPQPTNTLTDTQKVLIALGVALVVAAIVAAVVLTAGTSLFAVPALVASAIPVEGAVGVASAGAAVIAGASTTAALAAGSILFAAGGVATLVIAAVSPSTTSPNLKAVALDATFGKAFLSDMLFGTTSNTSISSPYVEYLLLQNEVNGSYALPRIIGYNPQLGFFDDGAYYGGVKAYLSLCTPAPHNTLRFEENGNLAIYDLTTDPPTWQSSTQVSSIKYKSGVRTITGAAATLQQIDCIYYNEGDVGVKAQQLEQLFSQATFGQGRRVRLEKLVPLLIEGMKELYELQELALGF